MSQSQQAANYRHRGSRHSHAHAYLLPKITRILEDYFQSTNRQRRLFDLGCGNGSVANYFSQKGYQVAGVDPSTEGVAQANAAFPHLDIHQGSAYDELETRFGTFSAVLSLEVVEHVYAPRDYASTVCRLLAPGGIAVISTPYHGYLKNLAIALSNSFDKHVNPLRDHGHIKFWSTTSLTKLLSESGLVDIAYHRVGRIPALAKSMIAVARMP